MASEILAVPEAHVADMICIIRAGLAAQEVPDDVKKALNAWCDEHEETSQDDDASDEEEAADVVEPEITTCPTCGTEFEGTDAPHHLYEQQQGIDALFGKDDANG